ncbi:MAG TPA: ATP-binding protein [Vicinamibacteria bacterium]|nr:ATP-binding protein [Vicinamibacteria bacterium]
MATSSATARGAAGLAEARLGLAEFLLVCDDLEECARRSLEWLAEYGGARAGACLAIDVEHTRLLLVASYGVGMPRELSVDIEDRSHPLVAAAFGREMVVFADRGHTGSPLGRMPIIAQPMYARVRRENVPAGLLVVGPTEADRGMVAWVASVLGSPLVRLGRSRSLTEADRRLRRERVLLDAVPDPILLTDPEGRVLIANARAKALLVAGEGESEGRRRAVALNNMLFSSALAQSAIQEGGRRELLLVDAVEGSDLLFELLSTVAPDTREGTAFVSILRNISDLRRATEEIEENYRKLRIAEEDVRAERDRLDLIIDSVADPVLVTDPAGALVMMNAPAERLFSVRAGRASEHTVRVQANDAHFSSFGSSLMFAPEGERRRGEIGLVDPETGGPLPVEAISGKILTEHGEVTAIVTVLHDRTEELERARLYEELKQASAQLEERVQQATAELVGQNELLRRQRIELEQASAAKSQFLANMSHEFRTPLNAILGYTSLLLQGVSGALGPQQERNLARVDSNARHLLAIINDILDISRIEAGKMPLHVSAFPLPKLIEEVVAELEPLIVRSNLSVRVETARKLPPISNDRGKVKQIVLNLVSNAIKFTPSGSVTVSTRYDRSAGEVSITVADTGIGIKPEDRERVFEDFRQADNSPAREYGGAGLGLSICRRLAHMMEGRLALESKVGQGSTFTLLLPRRLRRR